MTGNESRTTYAQALSTPATAKATLALDSTDPVEPSLSDGQAQTAPPASGADDTAVPHRAEATTPPGSPSGRTSAAAYTPMRRGRVHGLDDSLSNSQNVSERRARASADMKEKGKVVEDMRAGRFKVPEQRKRVAGGDAVRGSGIPVWGGQLQSLSKERPVRPPRDPFELAREQHEQMAALMAKHAPPSERGRNTGPKPLKLAQKTSAAAKGKQKALPDPESPPPVLSTSALSAGRQGNASAHDWQPLTQYLPHQREEVAPERGTRPPTPAPHYGGGEGALPNDATLEELHEAAARRIQDQLWAEEREYNRGRRAESARTNPTDPMEEDFSDEEEDDYAEIIASDSDAAEGGYDSFDEVSDITSVGGEEDHAPLLNIEPATGDDRAKAAARSPIFAQTKARIRWSPINCEPIAGMTQVRLVAGIDPEQLRQHLNAASSINNVFIGVVHGVGGTRSADLDRVTLVTALETMIVLTCRERTSVLFSAARQDPNGPRLRPGTVLMETTDDDLAALWQESAHWAQAGVRYTVQKYHQPHSAFMVTLEGTRRNRQAVAHGVRAAARKLTQLKSVFKQYDALYPGKGRAARDCLIKSVTARPLALTSKKALGFGTVQYNIFAQLHERDPDAAQELLTGDDEKDGFPPLTTEMHWAVRDAFQHITIVDGRLGDATPIPVPWDCGLCLAESHPAGKCDLKYVEGWFKTYEEFLAANMPAPKDRADAATGDRKGKAKAGAAAKNKPTGGNKNAGQRATQPRANTSRAGPSKTAPPRAGPSRRAGGH